MKKCHIPSKKTIPSIRKSHDRHIASILLASELLFTSGCLTAVSTTSFEKPKKSKAALSSTNFRLNNCSSAGVAKHLRKLETRQNHSLVPVPYDVTVSVDRNSSTQGQPWKAFSVLTLTVFPMWDVDRWTYRMNTAVAGTAPCVVMGRRTETCLMGWLALPFGMLDVVFGGGGILGDNGYPLLARDGDIDKQIADSVFRSLSEERYRKGFAHMAQEARSRLLKGETLSDMDERLLSELPEDAEMLAARAKNSADASKCRKALQKINGGNELVDIALHAKSPQIRTEAAKRVTGLSEDSFAGLVHESRDFDVGTIFLSKLTSEDLLCAIVKDDLALLENRAAALGKITGESILADIAKTAKAGDWFGMSAVKRIQTGEILANVAGNAALAEVRLEAIRKIDNAEVLLASVMNDSDARNRLAALTRIVDPSTFAKIARESKDVGIRLEAVKKVSDQSVLGSVVLNDSDEQVRLEALSRLDDSDNLRHIAENDSSEKVRATAVKKVSDSETLGRIARNDPSSAIRLSVVPRVINDDVILDIIANDESIQVRAAALKRVGDAAALVRIARTNSDESIRLSALSRVDDAKLLKEKKKGPIPWLLATTVPIPGKKYCMGKYEVTQSQWEAVMGENPSSFKDADNPVENVSWNDCQEFLEKLNALPAVRESNLIFRLPTEAEWVFACRAGATGKFCKLLDGTEIVEDTLGRVAWFKDNSSETTHPVGQLDPNAFGLYDMHGNVWEWCQEEYGEGEGNSSAKGLSNEYDRVNRGGSGNFSAWGCGASDRGWDSPDNRRDFLGFRLCADMHW